MRYYLRYTYRLTYIGLSRKITIRGDSIKTALLLYPYYKGDTRKLVKGVKENGMQVDVYDISEEQPELSGYDRLGIVSGIYAFQMGKPLMKYLREKLPEGKEIFIIYTYGAYRTGCMEALRDLIAAKESVFLGEYGCLGFDSFGPFKVSGPTLEDNAVEQELREYAKYIIHLLEA